jgi:hypothetical protein
MRHALASHEIEPAHEPPAAHSTSQLAPEQTTALAHELPFAQKTVHDVACVQSTLSQLFWPPQITEHGMPGGQRTFAHEPVMPHAIEQMPPPSVHFPPASAHAVGSQGGGTNVSGPASEASATGDAPPSPPSAGADPSAAARSAEPSSGSDEVSLPPNALHANIAALATDAVARLTKKNRRYPALTASILSLLSGLRSTMRWRARCSSNRHAHTLDDHRRPHRRLTRKAHHAG